MTSSCLEGRSTSSIGSSVVDEATWLSSGGSSDSDGAMGAGRYQGCEEQLQLG